MLWTVGAGNGGGGGGGSAAANEADVSRSGSQVIVELVCWSGGGGGGGVFMLNVTAATDSGLVWSRKSEYSGASILDKPISCVSSVDANSLGLVLSSVDASKFSCFPFLRFLLAESTLPIGAPRSGEPFRLAPPLQSSSMVGVVLRDCFLFRDCRIIRFSLWNDDNRS